MEQKRLLRIDRIQYVGVSATQVLICGAEQVEVRQSESEATPIVKLDSFGFSLDSGVGVRLRSRVSTVRGYMTRHVEQEVARKRQARFRRVEKITKLSFFVAANERCAAVTIMESTAALRDSSICCCCCCYHDRPC